VASALGWPATAVVTHKYNDKSEKIQEPAGQQSKADEEPLLSSGALLPLLSQENNGKQFGPCVCRGR